MTDVGDLAGYLEEHPNDHDRRWHLAKKLYMSTDYQTALSHLLILQTNWTPKVNVLRYLAAAYYRLGRYDEAIAELKSGIEEWPEEIPLREQLARVFEIAGRYEEAIEVWRDIVKRNPNNSMARRLLRKLQEAKPETREKQGREPEFHGGDLGAGGMTGSKCPSCGAQNSEEFDRCWKCHAPLAIYGMPDPHETPIEETAPAPQSQWSIMHIVCALAAAILIGLGVYLSIRQLVALREATGGQVPMCTVRDVFSNALLSTRIAAGLVLLAAWPLTLWLLAALMKPGLSARGPLLVGFLSASAGYLSLWTAPGDLPYVFMTVVFLSIIPIIGVIGMGLTYAIVVWFVQGALVLGFVLGTVCALEGAAFIREYPKIMHYAEVHDGVRNYGGEPGRYALLLPDEMSVRWDSTGVGWLDSHANRVAFEISSDSAVSGLTIEVKDATGLLFPEGQVTLPHKFMFDRVRPGNTCHLSFTGEGTAKLDVTVRGLLTPHFGN